MSIEQAKAFLNQWVAENVHAIAHPQDNTEANRLVKRCVEAAVEQGITKAELEQACGQDLVKCMCDAQVAVTDADEVMENDDVHR
jgi:DNA-binding transcriptional regulator YhcF (GntR family)